MGRFGGQDYPAPGWRRASPTVQEQVKGKSQTAPKETLVTSKNTAWRPGDMISTGGLIAII